MVSKQEIARLAKLAKLYVKPEELDGLTEDLNRMIRFADAVATSPEKGSAFGGFDGRENIFREDVPHPSFRRDDILKNAGSAEDGFFLVRHRR